MKNKFTFCVVGIAVLLSINVMGQSMSPDPINGIYCPNQTITFTVILPVGNVWSSLYVSGTSVSIVGNNNTAYNTKAANVITQPANVTFPGGTSTNFTFTGSFNDDNTPQTFQILYVINGVNNFYNVTYYKIESFSPNSVYFRPNPSPASITAPRCQTGNFNISFSNVLFANNIPPPVSTYGSITQYQYQLPTGWSLGGTTSTGSNWITGSNNVTVTSDLVNGDGENILIQAVSPCSSSFPPPLQAPVVQVPISRPAPVLSITPNDNINLLCSGSRTYTINGMPPGSTVLWSLTNPAVATIPPNSNSPSVIVTGAASTGEATLKASVTDCSLTYSVSIIIRSGAPQTNSEVIAYFTNANDCQYGVFQVLPLSGGYYTYSSIIKITDGSGVATQYVWSNPSGFNNSMIWIDNGDGSLTISSKVNTGIIDLRCTMSNGCGSAYKDYTFTTRDCSFIQRATSSPKFGIAMDSSSTDSVSPSEKTRAGALTIFPNPATSVITISGKAIGKKPFEYAVNIYDVTGSLKLSQKNSGHPQLQVDLSSLSAGLYIVEITNDMGKRSFKIMKH